MQTEAREPGPEALDVVRGRFQSTSVVLLLITLAYGTARCGQAVPEWVPVRTTAAAHVLTALAFMLVHGTARYGARRMLVFAGFSLLLGNLLENLGVATGFPFGRYHFTDVMGPRLLHVPILLGLAYIGMGYVSWTLAALLLGPKMGAFRLAFAAAFLMTAWDVVCEPVWTNLARAWTWHDGGSYFGIPLSNFAGWYLTNLMIYLAFGWHLRRAGAVDSPIPAPWCVVAFYAVSALGNLLVARPPYDLIRDASGRTWSVRSLMDTSALLSVFLMGSFAVFAALKLTETGRE